MIIFKMKQPLKHINKILSYKILSSLLRKGQQQKFTLVRRNFFVWQAKYFLNVKYKVVKAKIKKLLLFPAMLYPLCEFIKVSEEKIREPTN